MFRNYLTGKKGGPGRCMATSSCSYYVGLTRCSMPTLAGSRCWHCTKKTNFLKEKKSTAPVVQEALRETIIAMHEGNLESQQLTSMLSVQQQRDRYMARQLSECPGTVVVDCRWLSRVKKHGRTVTHGRSCHRHPSSGVDACRKRNEHHSRSC